MSSFATLIFVAVALLSKCEADLVGDFCSKSNDPSLCTKALRSDPRSKGADARGLGVIAIEKAEAATKASIAVANSVSNDSNKGIIETCVENFDDAVDILSKCEQLINKRDYSSIATLKTYGSAAMTDVATCSDEFGGNQPPKLEKATATANTFIQLLLLIAKTL